MTKTHTITYASGPLRAIALCTCGWRHDEPRKQNALGRASKLKGAANLHLRAVGASKPVTVDEIFNNPGGWLK